MRTIDEIKQWQEDFRSAPRVWVVEDSEGNLSGLYESREAAQLEIAAYPRHRMRAESIHSLDLSRRRWAQPAPQAPPTTPAKEPSDAR